MTITHLAVAHKISSKIGLDLKNCLGEGEQGVVFELEDGSVLKITDSFEEAAVCFHISEYQKHNPTAEIPNCYHVWRIATDADDLYAIHREAVVPLEQVFHSKASVDKINSLLSALHIGFLGKHASGIYQALQSTREIEQSKLAHDILKAMEILEDKYEITFQDLHSGNIGLTKSGHWTVFDFGKCGAPSRVYEFLLQSEGLPTIELSNHSGLDFICV